MNRIHKQERNGDGGDVMGQLEKEARQADRQTGSVARGLRTRNATKDGRLASVLKPGTARNLRMTLRIA